MLPRPSNIVDDTDEGKSREDDNAVVNILRGRLVLRWPAAEEHILLRERHPGSYCAAAVPKASARSFSLGDA